MQKIQRALISVSDKTGIVDLAKTLSEFKVEILSTGGTAKILKENNIPVKEVSEYTGFPEMLDGRVKTLHPAIHAGLLALRDNPNHLKQMAEQKIGFIDIVVVNLYPFEKVIQKADVSLEEAIENIDIGGPSMLRSAAKNFRSVAVVCNPKFYPEVIAELKKNNGALSDDLRRNLAMEVFLRTSSYDRKIYEFLAKQNFQTNGFPERLSCDFVKVQDLRYGENPHQRGAFYRDVDLTSGLSSMRQLGGKELSFNNILDCQAAVGLVREFSLPAVVFIKHNNPCGVAENKNILKAYRQAWLCDRLSAFGGIVGINRPVDVTLAKLIIRSGFLECVVAPGFSRETVEILKEKKNLRIIELPNFLDNLKQLDFKRVEGGLLVQEGDYICLDDSLLKIVTQRKPTKAQMQSLLFAWKVAKHVKSNAIVLARQNKTVGIGAGQMSRVDSVFIAVKKAGRLAEGAVLASDAFFPKEDAIKLAARYKIKAIIQPGGSVADEAIIQMANKYQIAMVTTGIRHFRH